MVSIDQAKCIGCSACAKDCVAGNINMQEGKAQSNGLCMLCGHCVAICPSEAASIPEYDMTEVESLGGDRSVFGIDDFLRAAKSRRSIRDYKDKPIEREKLEAIVQAGRYSATGANRQACRFVVVQEALPMLKDMIWNGVSEAEQPAPPPAQMLDALKGFAAMRVDGGIDYLFRNAPAVLYVAADSAVDAALAAQNMEMAAVAQGLGVLYNGFLVYATNMNAVAREWLDIKDKPVQVCMLAGYPSVTYKRTAPRRAADARWR